MKHLPLKSLAWGVFVTIGLIFITILFLKEEMIAYPQKPNVNVESFLQDTDITIPEAKAHDSWELQLSRSESFDELQVTQTILQKMGFSVFIDKTVVNKQPVYMLKIGPFLEKEEAKIVKENLKKAHFTATLKKVFI